MLVEGILCDALGIRTGSFGLGPVGRRCFRSKLTGPVKRHCHAAFVLMKSFNAFMCSLQYSSKQLSTTRHPLHEFTLRNNAAISAARKENGLGDWRG